MNRRILAPVAVLGVAIVVAGCAPTAPEPAPTVTVAATPSPTVTAAPLAITPDTPLQPIDAWAICVSFMVGLPQKVNHAYGPDSVTEASGVFTVITVGDGGPAGASCTITGTLGNPKVTDWHTPG